MQNETGIILSNIQISETIFKMKIKTKTLHKEAFPGKFLQIKCTEDSFILRKPISIFDSGPEYVEILYEIVGEGTKALSKRREGEVIELIGVLGNGFTIPRKEYKNLIFVSGGIGFAPLHFLAKRLVLHNDLKDATLSFFCGIRNKNYCNFQNLLKVINIDLILTTDDGSAGYKGYVSDRLDEFVSNLKKTEDVFIYACGPKPMLKEVKKIAEIKKIKCEIAYHNYMICGIGACLCCVNKTSDGKYKRVCCDGPVFDAKELII